MTLIQSEAILSFQPGDRADLAYALGLAVAYYEQTRHQRDTLTPYEHEVQEAFVALENLWTEIRKR